jgi:hypothetical protein
MSGWMIRPTRKVCAARSRGRSPSWCRVRWWSPNRITGSSPTCRPGTEGLEIGPDTRFVCSIAEFRRWASGRSGLRLEFFDRDMRRRNFIARHAERFASNVRMAMPLRNWQRMAPQRRDAIRARAAAFLTQLDEPAQAPQVRRGPVTPDRSTKGGRPCRRRYPGTRLGRPASHAAHRGVRRCCGDRGRNTP